MEHTSVLLSEALELLDPKSGETVIDVTVGLGGHAQALLEEIGRKGKLIGMDADAGNLEEAAALLGRATLSLSKRSESRGLSTRRPLRRTPRSRRVTLIHGNFRDIHAILERCTPLRSVPQCDILFADLGLSSPHLDDPERGFSFRFDAPLDLRFDQTQGKSAADLLNDAKGEELLRMFREYGELPDARPIVRKILVRRKEHSLARTTDLVTIAEESYGWRAQKLLPQIFQALRIAVNDELGALASLLDMGPFLLKPGGRMGVISYHSLEDRMVKERFRALSTAGTVVRQYELLTPKPIKPTMEESKGNPRSRSARLRVLRKV